MRIADSKQVSYPEPDSFVTISRMALFVNNSQDVRPYIVHCESGLVEPSAEALH